MYTQLFLLISTWDLHPAPSLIAHSISTSIIINIVIVLKYYSDQTVPAQIVLDNWR